MVGGKVTSSFAELALFSGNGIVANNSSDKHIPFLLWPEHTFHHISVRQSLTSLLTKIELTG